MSRYSLILLVALTGTSSWPTYGQEPATNPHRESEDSQKSPDPKQNNASEHQGIAVFSLPIGTPEPLIRTLPDYSQAIPPQPNTNGNLDRETAEAEKSMADSNRSMAISSDWMVGLTVVQTIIAIVGGVIIWRTLKATEAAVGETKKSTDALGISNNHLDESNRVAREAHNAERRPWLSVDVEIPNQKFTRVDTTRSHGYSFGIVLKFKNHGPSPAMNVAFFPDFRLVGFATRDNQMEELFRSAKMEAKNQKYTIFPEATKVVHGFHVIEDKDKDAFFAANNGKNASGVIFGVVEYASGWDGVVKQTRFAYHVMRDGAELFSYGPLVTPGDDWHEGPIVLSAISTQSAT